MPDPARRRSWSTGRCWRPTTTCAARIPPGCSGSTRCSSTRAPRRLGDDALRTEQGLAGLQAAAADCLSPAGQLQVATALDMLAATEARMGPLRKQLRETARHLTGARVPAARLYGAGPVTGPALTCWLAGKGRFSSSRKAVRFTGLDITVHSPDREGPPGRLSRPGPPVLRWAVYEAGKTHARTSAPDHRYYATVKDRKNTKRAALSEARKIVRQACHILTELGDDALTAARAPALHGDHAPRHPGSRARLQPHPPDGEPPRPAPGEPLPAAAGPCARTTGPRGRPDQTERPHPRRRGHPINHLVAGAAPKPRGPR
jgi:hypothetical protein